MTLRFHEIAEANHQILNPFTQMKLMLLGDICNLQSGMRHLDLACGKGEMLCRWSQKYGTIGLGVDISEVFLEAAKARAYELHVSGRVHFVHDDAAQYPLEHHEYDIVTCMGATWIGGGLVGTLELMRTALKKEHGLLVVGEPFWNEPPPEDSFAAFGIEPDTFTSLAGTLDRFEAAGMELIEMITADSDSWDRYEASQWMTVTRYLQQNQYEPQADELRAWIAQNRRTYLQYGRRYMGWGAFVLRLADE
ncbi:MAG: class I SAM-dependent methyltransferase [Chloroflexi bacterium]|nr:MAG: class I SAM-dependent methyltransferase [Chloroflexota bacterium]